MKVSKIQLAQMLMLTAMASFALALVRNSNIAVIFELLKFPFLVCFICFLFFMRPSIRITAGSIVMGSFLLLVVISTAYNSFNSPDLMVSVAVFFAIYIYFQVINNLFTPELLLVPLLRWFAISVIVTSVLYLPFPDSFIGGRFAAGFINTNVASGFIALSVVILTYIIFNENPKIIIISTLPVAVFMLLLTKGRGAIMAAFIPVIIMMIVEWRKKSKKIKLIQMLSIILFMYLYFKSDVSSSTDARDLGLLSFRAIELGAREIIIENHLSSFWHSPLIGVGAVIDEASPYSRSSGESSYTDLLALSGGIGAFLIGALIARALWVHWYRTHSRIGFYVLICALILAVSEGYLVSIASAISMLLWGLLAVSPRTIAK